MNENEARYIVRMMSARQLGILFFDSTDEDAKLFDRMDEWYDEGGSWKAGYEYARIKLILYIQEHGVPGGEYLQDNDIINNDALFLKTQGVPRIQRPV